MREEKCNKYHDCNAPLCPISEISIKYCIWYPDEEICTHRENSRRLWIKNQRKIKRRRNDVNAYFTISMLNRNFIIKNGISGLDPDKDSSEREWIKKHPARKPISEGKKRELAERLNKNLKRI